MKKITLLITFLLAWVITGYGQASGYVFSANTGTYTETSAAATALPLVRADTYISPAQNIGFNFVYEGVNYTQFKMCSNGFISLNMTGTTAITANDLSAANATSRAIIAPLWDDLDGATPASSVASYELTGTSPNQVLTIEWRNWEWNYASNTPVISFQVKLYETTNVIDFVYRQEATAVASGSATIGLGSATGSGVGSFVNVTNIATSAISNYTSVTNLNTKPATNQIYRWTPATCLAPTALAASNITPATATVSWTAPAAIPGSGYEYYYSASNIAPTGAGTATTNLTENLTGLSANTNYYLWIRSNCGVGNYSSWTGPLTFTTACSPTTDFYENFDSSLTGVGTLPNCWTRMGTSANVYNTTGSVAPMSPANRLYLNVGTAGQNAFAIMPPVSNLTANNHRLKFTAYATAIDKYLDLGYLTNASDVNSFVLIQSILMPSTAAATAQTFTVVPLTVPAGITSLVFRNQPATGTSTIYIDDVKWEINSSCVEPSALVATMVTNNSAQLGWTAGPETEWTVQYGLQNFTLGTGTIVSGVTTNPYTISGLSGNTTYQYYVRAVCTGSINSAWSGPFSFKTLCNSVTSFAENFDSSPTGTGNLPSCWTSMGTSTTVYNTTGSVAPMSPSNKLYLNAAAATNAFVALPPVSNLSAGTHRLKFTAYATSATRILEVGYLTDPSDVNSFFAMEAITMPSTAATTAQVFTIIPTAVPAGVTRLAFRNEQATLTSTIYIDDVKWEAIPSCVEPTNITVTGITANSANVNWTTSITPPANGYDYYLATAVTAPTATTTPTGHVGAGVTTAALSGLSSATTYNVWVRSVCSATDNSAWTLTVSFTTPCSAFVPNYTQDFATFPPTCWTRADAGTPATGPSGTGTGIWAADGFLNVGTTGAVKTNLYSLNRIGWLISPVMDMTAGNYRIKFDYGLTTFAATTTNNFGSDDYVQLVATQDNGATWTVLHTFNQASNVSNTNNTFTMTLPSYTSANTKFAFYATDGPVDDTPDVDFFVDNFVIETVPTCDATTNSIASAITSSTATISWTAPAAAPANGYDYYYSTSNTAPVAGTLPSGTVGAGITTVNLSGLNAATAYYVWVRSKCSASDLSVWSVSVTFTTACVAYAIPYSESFESITANDQLPACMAATALATINKTYIAATGSYNQIPKTGAKFASFRYAPAGNWFFSAALNLVAGTSYEVSVWYITDGAAGFTALNLAFGNAQTGAAMTVVGTVANPTNTTYQKLVANFTPTTSGTYYIGAQAAGTSFTPWYLSIDDLKVDLSPTCVNPTNVIASAITPASATISWTAPSAAPANGYDYYYSTSNTAPTAGTVPSGSVAAGITTVNLSGLTDASTYYVWVRSKCSALDLSGWSALVSFNTPCLATTVPYTQDFESATVPAMPLCTAIENAGTGNNWITANNPGYGFATKVLRYPYNGTNAANAWFYTQAIALTAGTNYSITYKYGNNSTTYVESLKVAYGTTANATGMTNPIADHPSITGGTATSTPTQNTVTFTPAVSGNYYFGFNAYSIANQYDLYVDDIAITTALGTNSFDNANFSYYPNPVKDVLNLSYTQNISNVAVYNLLGQEVITKKINANQSQIDMSHLSRGTYMVKVTADNQVKTIKVIKE